jgi:hypothetical protein
LRAARAVASFAFTFGAEGFLTALVLRFIGGIAVAGVHMPGLKLLIDRTDSAATPRCRDLHIELCR